MCRHHFIIILLICVPSKSLTYSKEGLGKKEDSVVSNYRITGSYATVDESWPVLTVRLVSAITVTRKLDTSLRMRLPQVSWSKHGYTCLYLPDISLCHDIEVNPGPVKKKLACGCCNGSIKKNQEAILCDKCEHWFHTKCSGLSKDRFYALGSSNEEWLCLSCCLPPLSDSFFTESDGHSTDDELSYSSGTNSTQQPIEWFDQHINGYYKNNLKIGHININSIYGKGDEVIDLLDQCQFDILFIGESKIDSSVSNALFTHPDYRIIRRDRKKGAGGMLVYIRSTVTAYRRVKLEPIGIESLCLDVKGNDNNWFLICACYRSPGKCKVSDFISSCVNAAERMYGKRKEIIFLGDFNLDMMKGNNCKGPNTELSNFCDQFCLTNVIHEATRVTRTCQSLLDVILVSHPERYATSGNLRMGISDHDLIYIIRKQKIPRPKAKFIQFRSMKNFNPSAFVSDIEKTPWDTAYIYDNADDVWTHWAGLYKQVLNCHAPLLKVRLRNNQLPWITPNIQREMRKRNRLYKKFRRDCTDANWIKYKDQRNKVSNLKRTAVRNFCWEAANSRNPSAGQFWKKMRPLLPNTKSNINSGDIHLIEGGTVIKNVPDALNKYFSTPCIEDAVLKLSEEELMDHPSVRAISNLCTDLDFSFEPVSSDYISSLLKTLDVKKSCGPDEISPKLLKLSAPAISAPVTKLINFCISTSTWPREWKLSNVSPVHKKNETTSDKNYRPISVLSAITKLFEKVKYDQLYAKFSPLFSSNMSGFLRGHSCCTALVKLTDDWRTSLDNKQQVGVVAIDLSKAFDSICHNLLLAKLKAYGLRESALSLIRSYLHDRQQRVKCNGQFSDWLPVRCGVPQGSLLGPLFFNIFVNDVNQAVGVSSLRLYADDTTQYAADVCPAALEFTINQDIKSLSNWFSDNYLQVNASKTQAMTLGKSKYTYDLRVHDDNIIVKDTLKILGVTLDKDLTFKPHINEMLKKAYAKIAALRRLKRLVPSTHLIRLHKAYVLPHLEYCSPILLGIGKVLWNKIESVNSYAIRTLLNLNNNVYDQRQLLDMASMRSLKHRCHVQSLILFFKCFRNQGPIYISNFFKPRVTSYNLRGNGNNVVQPSYNSLFQHNSFSYTVSHLWNQLQPAAKVTTSLKQFRKFLDKCDFTGCQCNRCLPN